MANTRASIFGDDEPVALDVTSFAPKVAIDSKAPDAEKVRAVAQAANFKSREPGASKKDAPKTRATRQYRISSRALANSSPLGF